MVALELSVTCMLLTCTYSFLIYRLTNRSFLKIKKVFIFILSPLFLQVKTWTRGYYRSSFCRQWCKERRKTSLLFFSALAASLSS